MDAFVELAFRAYVAERRADGEATPAAEYARFEPDVDAPIVGLVSTVQFGRIVYRDDRGQSHATESLAVKRTLDAGPLDADSGAMQFANEVHFYARVVPFFNEAVGGGGDVGNLDAFFPRFLFGCAQSAPGRDRFVGLYENLRASGYANVAPPTPFLDYAHLSPMARQLGRFHGYSHRARRHDPRRFQQLANFAPRSQERWLSRCNNIRPLLKAFVRSLSRDRRYATKLATLERVAENCVEFMGRANEADAATAVLCHGDYVAENVVFRRENGVPVDAKMLDLGACRLASPVLDLGHVLYVGADQRTRNRRWRDLVEDYRDGLRDILGHDRVPSHDDLMEQFRRNGWYAFVIASLWIPERMAKAAGLPSALETCSRKFPERGFAEIEEEEFEKLYENFEYGGPEATEAIHDVMRDMIDRNFV